MRRYEASPTYWVFSKTQSLARELSQRSDIIHELNFKLFLIPHTEEEEAIHR